MNRFKGNIMQSLAEDRLAPGEYEGLRLFMESEKMTKFPKKLQ